MKGPGKKPSKTIAIQDFAINEVVWGKFKGWPHWPARVVAINTKKIEIVWFNDYRKSQMFRSQLFKFKSNFENFTKKCHTNAKLDTATKEAILYINSGMS